MDINFNVGDAVELLVEEKKYRTVVERQIDAETTMIYAPITKGHVLPIKEGEKIEIVFVVLEAEQNKYDVYTYEAVVESREINSSVPMLTVKALSPPKKIQRRDFFRLNIVKTILIESVVDDSTIEVVTQDISAGGMQAISPKKLNKDDEYLVYMNIFAEFPIVLRAKVLSSELTDTEYNRYVNRFYFTNIDKKLQGDMIRQINNLQVLEIRRRKMDSPLYKDSLKSYLDEELLDRYNLDKKVDKKLRYLSFFNIALALLMLMVFVMAMPNTEWAPLFGSQVKRSWNFPLLKIDIFISAALFLASSLGSIYDRMNYGSRRQINLFFVLMLLFSTLFLLGLIIFTV